MKHVLHIFDKANFAHIVYFSNALKQKQICVNKFNIMTNSGNNQGNTKCNIQV